MPATPLRNIRVADELWKTATAIAWEDDASLSDVIREFLGAYVKSPRVVRQLMADVLNAEVID